MAISLRDRERVSDLIKKEYYQKKNEATRDPTDLEVSDKEESLKKRLRLTKSIEELKAAEEKVKQLKKKLIETVKAAKPETMVIRNNHRYDNCECTGDYRELLREVAKHIVSQEIRATANRTDIDREERRLLAKVEVASSTEVLNDILKKAGLL